MGDIVRPLLRGLLASDGIVGKDTNDATVVILASEALSELLKLTIVLKFRKEPSRTSVKELFGFSGPLGSFSSRIILCSVLGIADNDMRHNLDVIRDIRNKFCHALQPRTFNDPEIIELCNGLRKIQHEAVYKEVDLAVLFSSHFAHQWKNKFVYSVFVLLFNLLLVMFLEYEEIKYMATRFGAELAKPAKENFDREVVEKLMKIAIEAFEKRLAASSAQSPQ